MTLAELEGLDRSALAVRWQETLGLPAPRKCGAGLLRSALAWELQNAAAGSRDPTRSLRSSLGGRALLSGTRLVREWQGRTYRLDVVPAGFMFDGKRYRSLSAIARLITGTAWSGPAFFGVRK